jgi:hypothetical protein
LTVTEDYVVYRTRHAELPQLPPLNYRIEKIEGWIVGGLGVPPIEDIMGARTLEDLRNCLIMVFDIILTICWARDLYTGHRHFVRGAVANNIATSAPIGGKVCGRS